MDKLTIEEKAKAYDEAIKRVENIKTGKCKTTFMFTEGLFEHIFPELKEDEEIKKALIEHFAGAHSSMYPYKGFTKEQILAWIEKQKPTDKVEPKFHKGEWIVFNGFTFYIGEDKSFYGTTTRDGINNSYDWDIDNVARLWTIKDAKDGDILYAKICDEEWLYLYNNLIDDPDFLGLLEKSWVNNYCCYRYNDGWFSYEKQEAYPVNEYSIISPATKEQRDTLMKAMADAGYTFDFEKKELRKIEQKPTWSEEDESKIKGIMNILEGLYDNAASDTTKDLYRAKIDWLKSLKPQIAWKPTAEQMKVLKETCVLKKSTATGAVLCELYHDLEKLREE